MPQLLDSDYHSATQNTNEETTPSQHKVNDEGTPEATKRRVDLAASSLSGQRCVVLNVEEINSVEYAHCLPRSTKSNILDSLEFAWNMNHGTLNVDTRYNIFRLNAIWHSLFDRGKWFLVPKPSIVKHYLDQARGDRKLFKDIESAPYHYRILALSDMRPVPIHRIEGPIETSERDLSASDFRFFKHPYTDLEFVSHLHPRYVICNAGEKIRSSGVTVFDLLRSYPELDRLLEDISLIYAAWTKPVFRRDHPDFFRHLDDDDDDDSSGEDNQTNKTKSRRVNRPKRKAPKDRGSPQSKATKQRKKTGNQDVAWLDEETLHELDSMTSADKRQEWKKKRIIGWLDHLAGPGDLDGKNAESVGADAHDNGGGIAVVTC